MLGVKLVYMLMQCLLLGLGIWKVNAMGLLPYVLVPPFAQSCMWSWSFSLTKAPRTTRSDWLAWETEREPLERAYLAF